jgi:hypothetical protein
MDVRGTATLIFAVVPFEQVPIDLSYRPKASELTSPGGALQWAGKHPNERQTAETLLKPARIVFPTVCERQIGKSCVLA